MKYQQPEIVELANAISAIQASKSSTPKESPSTLDVIAAYEDWEE
jgi:hypothetical protein